jgi:transposase-like protein
MQTQLLTPDALASRWSMNSNTLRYWRWNGQGPSFLKIGRRVLYRMEDIEQFEKAKLRQNTSQKQAQEFFTTLN